MKLYYLIWRLTQWGLYGDYKQEQIVTMVKNIKILFEA